MTTNFRVIIVGGSFGGLTLAMALERYGIDYVLLESKSSFTPTTGATIGLAPRGDRILDQLGLYDDLLATKSAINQITWVNGVATRNGSKTHMYLDHAVGPETLEPKFGYQFLFNRRQRMLKIIWSGVWYKHKCLTGKKVTRIEERGDKVVAFCGDETFEGDVLVGADGVRSVARREMWRIGNEQKAGTFSDKEMTGMSASMKCLYGYSKPANYAADYDRGCFHCAVEDGRGMICFMSVDHYANWAVYQKLDRRYKSHEIPRYTDADARAFAETMRDLPFNKSTTFGDVLDNAENMHLAALEEGNLERYQHGRILCIGDAVHKTTPHIGIGANFAIDGAANAANVIKRFKDGKGPLSDYPGTQRHLIDKAYKDSYVTTRTLMYWGWPNKVVIHTFLSFAPDIVLQWAHPNQAGASKLDYLPVPRRSVEGWMPFNPVGVSDNIYLRMLLALPLFAYPALLELNYTLYAIMLLEAARRINVVTFTALPNLTLLLLGPWALPAWFWLHFVFAAPLRRYQSSTNRLTNMTHLRAVLPVALIGLRFGFGWAGAASMLVGRAFPGTIKTDWRDRPFRDVGLVRATAGAVSLVAAVDWWVRGEQTWARSSVAALAWMGLLYADLFRLSHVRWWQVLLGCLTVPVLGSNAALAMAWMYREELLRTSRDKNAITEVGSAPHMNGAAAAAMNGSAASGKADVGGGLNGTAHQNGSASGKMHQNGHAH